MNYTIAQPATYPRTLPPVTIKAGNALMIRASHTFTSKLYRQPSKRVFLLNGKDKVLSLRPEYCDHNFEEHGYIVGYRALVWDTIAKESRFVDLASGQLLKVI